MLVIKKETDYAIQFLKILEKYKKRAVSLKEVADLSEISYLFLQKIARKLRFGGLIVSAQGARGGYTLKLPAIKITLKKIIEVMEGVCAMSDCLADKNKCLCQKKKCAQRIKLKKINKQLEEFFNKIKLNNL